MFTSIDDSITKLEPKVEADYRNARKQLDEISAKIRHGAARPEELIAEISNALNSIQEPLNEVLTYAEREDRIEIVTLLGQMSTFLNRMKNLDKA